MLSSLQNIISPNFIWLKHEAKALQGSAVSCSYTWTVLKTCQMGHKPHLGVLT